jgi:hypothetical protein
MRWFYHLIIAALIWAALVPSARGESLPDSLAVPPESGVRDAGGFFKRDAGAMERISGKFRQLEKNHGYRIYLVVEPVLIATTAAELAAQLQHAWLPAGNGLVVVFEADSRSLAFGRDVGGNPDPSAAGILVPTHETDAMLKQVVAATDKSLAPETYIETLTGNLVREFNGYFERLAAPPPPGRSLRFALLTTGGVALLALCAIAVGALTRLKSVAGIRSFRFPTVDRPERLGAPCGGSVTTRSFRPGPRN